MDPCTERDEVLMEQAARGQADRLEPLVRRHAIALLTFLTRMTGDRHCAEELFQEVFLAVWINRQQFDPARPFRPWLYAIALNRCRAEFRRRAVPVVDAPELAEPADPCAGPDERLCALETAEQVSRAIARLPEQQRAVVVLRVWEGMPYGRIAEIVGCTEGTVRSHMHHGLAALRQHLHPLVEAQT